MVELKKYQRKSIDILKDYLKELEKNGSKRAFMYITETPYKSEFFNEVPFVCIKIPTGGGKTFVGCHSVVEIMSSILKHKMDRGIVMWFVPSEAIKSQTLKKFKDRNDWHRKVLDEAFDNNIRIFSNEEALRIRKEDVEDNICIIISSLEAFRKEKAIQNKYKVYQENGALLSHFENLEEKDFLEKDEHNTIINSLANVIKLSNPLIVIDEGHKTKTKLSIEFMRDLNPSFIIEYTATPRPESNILVEIHSSELKGEQMVKLPIVLESTAQWQNSILRGVLKREELEKESKKNKSEYIRPIALLQAEQEKESDNKITVQKIKDFLIKERKIPEEEIAIKTSSINELEGINLFSQQCKIRYIITVNALAEGWDCSFAYVLISVANIGSKIAVEQIIGRIVRMTNARRKENEALNRSYIFASAKNFQEASEQIILGLESNGFSKLDLINATNEDQTHELDVEKAVKENLFVPMLAFEDEKLSFEDLIGEEFELAKQNAEFDFTINYDNDGRALIDIQGQDKWVKSAQQILKITYKDKNFSKEELIQWLDKKLRFTILEKSDKIKFIQKVIEYQLKKKSLSELSVNRYVLVTKLSEIINHILEDYAKKRFDEFIKNKKISVKDFEKFPEKITLFQEIFRGFNKNYYSKIDRLNKEELKFVERLDLETLPNIKFWIRNREKKDPFFIQGWKKNKFYPDFIAVTKNNNIIVLEWKGEDRKSNEDTQYKEEIGKIWESIDKNLHFFLVHNGNIEEILSKLKNL
ncbi:MAG: DEAD/DEAH box helicase [Nanoarchaeota archaeon]